MKKLILKLRSVFWSWRFLKVICVMISFIVLFYVEEDWRGARTWAATKAGWEAKGESFDVTSISPPIVPDDQNLGAIPLFEQVPVRENASPFFQQPERDVMTPVALKKAIGDTQLLDKLVHFKLQNGEPPDLLENISMAYEQAFHSPPLGNAIQQLETLYPLINDLRKAAATRPYCQFKIDQSNSVPMYWPFSLLIYQLYICRLLNLHAILALDNHQPDVALEDFKLSFKLIVGTEGHPCILSGLLQIAMTGATLAAISDGIVLHAWSDVQLADLQTTLAGIDILQQFQRDIRGGTVGATMDLEYLKMQEHSLLEKNLVLSEFPETQSPMTSLWPNGWFDLTTSGVVDFNFRLVQSVNSKAHRIFPDQIDQLNNEINRLEKGWCCFPLAPWNIVVHAYSNVPCLLGSKVAHMQALLDEAQIVCALERFRLAHGQFPHTLEELKPYATQIPNDVVSGLPYHYQLRADGAYLLYSLGWNQKDDGGAGMKSDKSGPFDYKTGDWFWLTNHD